MKISVVLAILSFGLVNNYSGKKTFIIGEISHRYETMDTSKYAILNEDENAPPIHLSKSDLLKIEYLIDSSVAKYNISAKNSNIDFTDIVVKNSW